MTTNEATILALVAFRADRRTLPTQLKFVEDGARSSRSQTL